MKLAKLVGDGCLPWTLYDGTRVDISPGTIVQYKWVFNGGYDVYFPGVRGFAWVGDATFHEYFELL